MTKIKMNINQLFSYFMLQQAISLKTLWIFIFLFIIWLLFNKYFMLNYKFSSLIHNFLVEKWVKILHTIPLKLITVERKKNTEIKNERKKKILKLKAGSEIFAFKIKLKLENVLRKEKMANALFFFYYCFDAAEALL